MMTDVDIFSPWKVGCECFEANTYIQYIVRVLDYILNNECCVVSHVIATVFAYTPQTTHGIKTADFIDNDLRNYSGYVKLLKAIIN